MIIKGVVFHFKVMELQIEENSKDYYGKVLNLSETLIPKVLGKLNSVVINDLSFNSYPSYLLHVDSLA